MIIMASVVLRTRSISAIFCPDTIETCQVSNFIADYEKNEQVKLANLLNRQTLVSNLPPHSLKHLSAVKPYEKINCCDSWNSH